MKIGFVVDDTLDKPDGVQQYVLTLGQWLKSQGHEVHYLVGETKRDDVEHIHSLSKNIHVRFNKNRLSIPLPNSSTRLKKLVQGQSFGDNFDVLHVQMPHNPLLAAKIVRYAHPTTAIVGTFHIAPYSKFETSATRLLGLALQKNLKLFDQIISVSPTARDFAKKTFNANSRVLPNVVDVQKFRTTPSTLDVSTITFLGRLVERKGCEHLLRALSIMEKHHPKLSYTLRICGDGAERDKLERLVETLQISGTVDFTGFVTEEEKKRYLAKSTIAVFPSLSGESFGIVLIEAMAAGSLVVLGGDNPGYRSVLGEVNGSLVDPRDHEEFAGELAKILTDKTLVTRLHAKQQEVVKKYDVRQVGPQIVEVYKEAIAKTTKRKHN